ncbi:MAG: hypothetical protein KDI82_16600 [Gammaproteobacteria bacterium]|nr:hypothetical protein [Gammaproteobacteria bacterium]
MLSAALGLCLLPTAASATEGYPPPPGSYPLGPTWQTVDQAVESAPDTLQPQRPGLLLPRNDGQDSLNGGLGSTLFGAQPSIDTRPATTLPTPGPAPLPEPVQRPPAAQYQAPRSDFSVDFSRRQSLPIAPQDDMTPFQPRPQSYAPYPAPGYGPRSPAPGYTGAEQHYAPSPMSTFRESVLAPAPASRYTAEPTWASEPPALPAPLSSEATGAALPPASGHAPMFRPPDLSAD